MAVRGNSSDEVVVNSIELYTGLCNLKVVGINPTKAELEQLGKQKEEEPKYIQDDGTVRVEFHVEGIIPENIPGKQGGDVVKSKVAFFLENKQRENRDGTKFQFVDKAGNHAWGTSLEDVKSKDYKWMDNESLRPAIVGSEHLYNFIQSWINVKPGDECKLEKEEELAEKGDVSELKGELLANFSDNEVTCLLVVADGKYQNVHERYFTRGNVDSRSLWAKYIQKEIDRGASIKGDFQGSLDLQKYSPDVPSEESEEKASTDPENVFG